MKNSRIFARNYQLSIVAIKHLKLLCLIILSAFAFPSAIAMDLMARSVISNQDLMDDYRASTLVTGRGIDCFRGSDVVEHLGISAASDSIIFEIDITCYDDAGNAIGRFHEAPIVGYRVSPAFFNDPEAIKCLIRKIY